MGGGLAQGALLKDQNTPSHVTMISCASLRELESMGGMESGRRRGASWARGSRPVESNRFTLTCVRDSACGAVQQGEDPTFTRIN